MCYIQPCKVGPLLSLFEHEENTSLPSCLGIESKKGTLRPGAHADFAVLDKEGHVLGTWVRGKQVFTRSAV